MTNQETEVLIKLISEDYTVEGNGRFLHTAEHDSLVIDTQKGLWFWNSRGISGTAYYWLVKVKGYSHNDAVSKLKSYEGYADTFIYNVKDREEVVVYPKLVDVFYENGLKSDKWYWFKRGLNDETIHRFKLGYYDGWYTIPFYQDGVFRDFQLRRDNPEKRISHYYRGVGRLLYNSDILKITSSIVITEGPTDCLRLLQEGIPCISHNAGSGGWDNEWFRYFVHQSNIYVVYDNDEAGLKGAKKVAKNLGTYRTHIYTFRGYENKFDVIDYFNAGGNAKDFMSLVRSESRLEFQL